MGFLKKLFKNNVKHLSGGLIDPWKKGREQRHAAELEAALGQDAEAQRRAEDLAEFGRREEARKAQFQADELAMQQAKQAKAAEQQARLEIYRTQRAETLPPGGGVYQPQQGPGGYLGRAPYAEAEPSGYPMALGPLPAAAGRALRPTGPTAGKSLLDLFAASGAGKSAAGGRPGVMSK